MIISFSLPKDKQRIVLNICPGFRRYYCIFIRSVGGNLCFIKCQERIYLCTGRTIGCIVFPWSIKTKGIIYYFGITISSLSLQIDSLIGDDIGTQRCQSSSQVQTGNSPVCIIWYAVIVKSRIKDILLPGRTPAQCRRNETGIHFHGIQFGFA